MRNRSTLLLAIWAALLLVVGGVAAATHEDDKNVATEGRPGGQSSTSSTQPGATGTTTGAGTDSSGSTSSSAAGTDTTASSGGDDPVVDPGTGGSSPAARIMPTPGTYSVAISGTAKLNGTPSPVPASGTYTIRQVNDTDTETTGEFNVVLRWSSDAARLTRLTITAVTKTFEPPEPVLFSPFPGAVGQTWEWTMTSTDGKTTVHQTAQITGTETLDIGGQAVDTFIVQSHLDFSGDMTGTVDVTTWASNEHRLSVKTHTVTNVRFGLFLAQSDLVTVLVSLTPS